MTRCLRMSSFVTLSAFFALPIVGVEAGSEPKVRVEVATDEHPMQHSASGMVNGFALQTVYRIDSNADPTGQGVTIAKHHLSEEKADQKRRLQQAVMFSSSERHKVRTLAQMNKAVYPRSNFSVQYEKLQEIYDAGVNLYGDGESGEDRAASETAWNNQWMDLHDTYIQGKWEDKFNPTGNEANGLGVAAAVYSTAEMAVIVFRGSYTSADNTNMLLWFEGWFLTKLKQQIQNSWQFATGSTTLSEEMQRRAAQSDMLDRAGFLGVTNALHLKQDVDWLKSGVADALNVIQHGYWPLTKQLVTDILATHSGKTIYITGHSQGGGRAVLASMWLKKSQALTIPTYTFAGVGVQCAVRYALPDMYASDVDVTIRHENVVQYVHALDPYGQLDYQVGKVYKFGTADLRDEKIFSPTKSLCERVVGYSGATLLLPKGQPNRDFGMCRYFTHWSHAIVYHLSDDAILNPDGTTDGGRQDDPLIADGDPDGKCPPCRNPRCLLKIPKIVLGWRNEVKFDPIARTVQAHPCVDNRGFSSFKFQTVALTGDNTKNGLFDSCVLLGTDSNYMLTGKSAAADAQLEKIYSLALHYEVTPLLSYDLRSSLWMEDTSDLHHLSQHVAMIYTMNKDDAPQVLLDVKLEARI